MVEDVVYNSSDHIRGVNKNSSNMIRGATRKYSDGEKEGHDFSF
jgi:hypothetical protein